MSTEEFVDCYNGRKKRIYENARDSLAEHPLEEKDAFIQAFIKDEKTNFNAKPNACPRIIQPRSPRFNLTVGVYLKPFEKAVFRALSAVFRGIVVAKGLNAVERGNVLRTKWVKFDDPVAIFLDAKRFDQHCSREMIDWLHYVEEKVFPQMKQYNDMRKQNRCFARAPDGSVKYTVNRCVMSGDMDTASGDTLMMCAVTWTIMRNMGVKFEYTNDGDDGVLMIEALDAGKVCKELRLRFLEFGFTMKVEGMTDTFERIIFCQTQPVFDGNKWVMVRQPKVALAKDSVTLRRVRDADHLDELRNAMGWCGMSLAGNMPIYRSFYKTLICGERPELEMNTGMAYLARGLEPIDENITDECRLSFWKAFGIHPTKQLVLEDLCRKELTHNNPVPVAFNTEDLHIKETIEDDLEFSTDSYKRYID
jgi:hypothetical protein